MKLQISRRAFVQKAAVLGSAAFAGGTWRGVAEGPATGRKMKLCLSPGAIGLKVGPHEVIELAKRHGFEAVEPNSGFLAGLSESALAELKAELAAKGMVFGAADLPVDFRGDQARFRTGVEVLGRQCPALQRAGVTRVGTWIAPGDNKLTYLENFRQHAARLGEVARILRDHGLRLGLEYVGTPSSRQGRRYPFIHCLREMRELVAEIGTGNVGLVLDSWHWWTAREEETDVLALKAEEVISVDLNDAPAGLTLDQQRDGKRELPAVTGIIPVGSFLRALKRIGYDGPVRAEPFNAALNALAPDAACAAAITALQKAMAMVG